MKKVIGGEISREEPRVIDLTKSLNVLDLRKPLPKSEPQPAPKPTPPELPLEQPTPAEQPQRKEEGETAPPLMAEEKPSEQAGAGTDTGGGEETGSVRPREEGISAAPKKKKRFALPRWSLRRIAIEAVKLLIVLVGAVFFLSLGIDLPERLIGIYFVASVVYAIDSQRTFLVALIFLVMVAVWSAFGQNVPAENYAIYAFYFLVIGLISALRELVVQKPRTQGKNPGN